MKLDLLNFRDRITILEDSTNSQGHLQWMLRMLPPSHFSSLLRLADQELHERLLPMMQFLLPALQLEDPVQGRIMESQHQHTSNKAVLNRHKLPRMIPRLMKNSTRRPQLRDNNKCRSSTPLAQSPRSCQLKFSCNINHNQFNERSCPSQKLNPRIIKAQVDELAWTTSISWPFSGRAILAKLCLLKPKRRSNYMRSRY